MEEDLRAAVVNLLFTPYSSEGMSELEIDNGSECVRETVCLGPKQTSGAYVWLGIV